MKAGSTVGAGAAGQAGAVAAGARRRPRRAAWADEAMDSSEPEPDCGERGEAAAQETGSGPTGRPCGGPEGGRAPGGTKSNGESRDAATMVQAWARGRRVRKEATRLARISWQLKQGRGKRTEARRWLAWSAEHPSGVEAVDEALRRLGASEADEGAGCRRLGRDGGQPAPAKHSTKSRAA